MLKVDIRSIRSYYNKPKHAYIYYIKRQSPYTTQKYESYRYLNQNFQLVSDKKYQICKFIGQIKISS